MMTTSDPRWIQLVREEAQRTSITAVAVRLNYSRTAISLAMRGEYTANTNKIEAQALAVLEPVLTVVCPYLGEEIAVAMCVQVAGQRAPTHNPSKMNHWRACRQCQNNCNQGDKK